jgi:hypothetical protein
VVVDVEERRRNKRKGREVSSAGDREVRYLLLACRPYNLTSGRLVSAILVTYLLYVGSSAEKSYYTEEERKGMIWEGEKRM